MKTKILGVVLTLGAVAGAFMSCSEPSTVCQVGLADASSFATVYVPTGPIPAGCESLVQPGDIVGMQFYYPATADKSTFDTTKSTVAIQADFLGNAATARGPDKSKTDTQFALGSFAAQTPVNGVCSVPTFTESAQQSFPDVPAVDGGSGAGGGGGGGGSGAGGATPSSPELPADTIKYNWSNFEVTVTPSLQGTEFTADLTYTQTLTPKAGAPLTCTLQYKAVGIWPAVQCVLLNPTTGVCPDGVTSCEFACMDATCSCPPTQCSPVPLLDANGNQQPDITRCSPCEDPDAGRTVASGLAPEIPTACQAIFTAKDPYAGANFGERSMQYYCVLAGASAKTVLPATQVAQSCGPIAD